jgi:alpha-tubulin suppressor-like RCC1 family protein
MKTKKTKRLQLLSSCLILASTLGVFACQSSGNDTTQKKTDDTSDFTVSKFDNHTLLAGASVKAKVALPTNTKPNSAVHIDISSSDATILDSDKKSCDLTAQSPSCEVSLTAKNVGAAYAKFKSGTTEHSSETLSVVAESLLSIGGLDQSAIMLDAAPITANVSFPNGTSLDKDVSVNITSEPADAVTIAGSPCSLSNTHLSCDFTIKGNKVVDKVIISAKANNGKTATKEIKVINKPTLYIRGLTDVTATQLTHAMIGVVGPANNLKVSVSSSKPDVATVALSSPDCTVSPNPTAETIATDNGSDGVAYECEITITTKTKGSTDIIATASNAATATQTLNVLPFIKSISGGSVHTCATDADNHTYCWGSNAYGQLGDGKGGDGTGKGSSLLPIKIAQEYSMTKVKVLNSQSIALATDGSIYGWGKNTSGQLGIGEPKGNKSESLPQKAISSSKFTTVSSGSMNTCAIDSDQKLYCWGSNASGLNGNNMDDAMTLVTTPTRVQSDVNFITLFEGDHTACAITTEGKLYCWGHNDYGQINATRKNVLVPTIVDIPGVNKVIKVALGYKDTCVLSDTHDAYCWGLNTYGQNGDGTKNRSATPQLVLGGLKFIDLATSASVTCGITEDGATYCWGQANIGTLGDGKTVESTTPVMVKAPGIKFVNLSVYSLSDNGGGQAIEFCGATDQGKAYCWGDNDLGQLGTGTLDVANSPVAVKF